MHYHKGLFDKKRNYTDPQFCEDNGIDYELAQEYISSWQTNRSLEREVKKQLADARKANQAQVSKGEKGEKNDN